MGPRRSAFEWRNERKPTDQAFERLLDAPHNLFSRRSFLTSSAKREVYMKGIPGRAEILKAPTEDSISDIAENVDRFRVRVEIPGQPPYEKPWRPPSRAGRPPLSLPASRRSGR
jgi:hypothetical protein